MNTADKKTAVTKICRENWNQWYIEGVALKRIREVIANAIGEKVSNKYINAALAEVVDDDETWMFRSKTDIDDADDMLTERQWNSLVSKIVWVERRTPGAIKNPRLLARILHDNKCRRSVTNVKEAIKFIPPEAKRKLGLAS